MFAIVKLGSAQYKVSEGDVIHPNRLKGEKGDEVTLDHVLLFADGANVQIGRPYLENIKVQAKVVDHGAGDKVVAYKYRLRKSSAVKKGHRQKLTALSINKITVQ